MTEGPEQTPAFRSYDGPFRYTGPTGHEGLCYLQIFERRGALPVVLAWEEKSNPGASVTNAAAQVATQAWRRLLPQAREGIIFVEGYVDPRQLHLAPGERFAEVTFDLDGDALHSPLPRPRSGRRRRGLGGVASSPAFPARAGGPCVVGSTAKGRAAMDDTQGRLPPGESAMGPRTDGAREGCRDARPRPVGYSGRNGAGGHVMAQGPERPTPQWQPIDKLPVIADAIDGMLESAEEQYPTLEEARPRPSMLDDYTVGRVVGVYTEQRDDLWLYEEQLRRWHAGTLTEAQRREVERLTGQLGRLRAVIDKTLALMDELKGGTIEKMMSKSDLEVGLEMLTRLVRKQGH